jgi:hypothetical protein
MSYRALLKRTLGVLALIASTANCLHAQHEQGQVVVRNQGTALGTLQLYLQLRLNDADWKQYSPFITWPDEPGWDCKWVARQYSVGAERRTSVGVTVPVIYKRLGLYCDDIEFRAGLKSVIVNYKLVRHGGAWKVNAPIPDYPDINAEVLLKYLQKSAEDPQELRERREMFRSAERKIKDSLSSVDSSSVSPHN